MSKMRGIVIRKRQVLKYVYENPGARARDVAKGVRVSIPNAEMFLFRMFRDTLVDRKQGPAARSRKPCFEYECRDRGVERLKYWDQLEILQTEKPTEKEGGE
jgi:hypothetical protein